jgi:putative transposase
MDQLAIILSCISPVLGTTLFNQMNAICSGFLCMTGRITMLGISRWTGKGCSYRTVQRFFQSIICWDKLNLIIIKRQLKDISTLVLGGDGTVVTKAGKFTYGIGKFFSSIQSKVVNGLGFQTVSVIDVSNKKSWPILIEQMQPKKSEEKGAENLDKPKRGRGRPKGSKNKSKKEVILNPEMQQIQSMLSKVKSLLADWSKVTIKYFVYDGALGNNAGLQMVLQSGFHLVSKLKNNSALYLPWSGAYSGKGAPRKYGLKLDFRSISEKYLKFENIEDGMLTRYFQLEVLSKSFACPLNIVVIYKKNLATGKIAHVILFSSDLGLGWEKIVEYYNARFQIEFNFRDAKQFWGLEDFMVVKEVCVNNAANLSFFMVNLSQSLLPISNALSINDLKSHYHGLRYVDEVLKLLPKNADIIKKEKLIEQLSALGRIHEVQKAA